MAEDTPGNLASAFGGWASGRAAGNKRIDESVDRLNASIERLSSVMDKASGTYQRQSRGGGGSSQQTQTSSSNGGGPTFGGSSAAAPTSHRGDSQSKWSEVKDAVAGGGMGGGGNRSNGGGVSMGGEAWNAAKGAAPGAAKGALGAAAVGTAIYTRNHFSNQVIGQSLAYQYAGGPNWSQAYHQGLQGNYSAQSAQDNFAASGAVAGRGGFVMGSSGYNQARNSALAMSQMNPQISNTQAVGANMALGGVGTYNKMQGLGINPMGASGHMGSARSTANQVLQKIPGISNVKTPAQVAAMFAPNGGATVTIDGMIANGYMPAESREAVLSEMRSIMQARVHGVSYQSYNKASTAAATHSATSDAGSAARKLLQGAGLGNSLVNQQRNSEGMSRDSEGKTIDGFNKGVSESTKALNKFRDALNKILGIPGVGGTVGAVSGATGNMPILGGLLGKIPGGGLVKSLVGAAGGSAPTMSMSSYGSAGSSSFAGSGGTGMASMSQVGGGHGGVAAGSQSKKGKSGSGSGSGGSGSAGIRLIAPRPGINSMSSEQDFGPRTIGQGFHTGIDLEGGVGAPIKAAASGVVSAAGWGAGGEGGGYGNVTMINHGGGWVTMYAHQSRIGKAKGAHVRQGEIIGSVGETGSFARGAHLHFELHKNGKPVDPVPYITGGKSMTGATGTSSASTSPTTGTGSSSSGVSSGGLASGGSADLGSTGSYANAVTSTSSDGGGGGGGGGNAYGAYSELGALGLGGGSSLGGAGGGGSSSEPAATTTTGGLAGSVTSGGTGTSGVGGVVGGGGGGRASVRIAGYNVHSSTTGSQTLSDFNKLTKKSDVIAFQELQGKKMKQGLAGSLAKMGWGYYQGHADTGLAWDKSKYDMERSGTRSLNPNTYGKAGLQQRFASYGLFKNKNTGAEFWEVSVHTVPRGNASHTVGTPAQRAAIEREQHDGLQKLFDDLKKTGAPVMMSGDMNTNVTKGLKGVISDRGRNTVFETLSTNSASGHGTMTGLNSDHNATLSTYQIGGSATRKSSSGGSNGGGTTGLTGNRAAVNQEAAKYGWGRGSQWNDLVKLVNSESGFRNTAQNPHSTAFGMFQFLDSTWKGYTYPKTADAHKQSVDGMEYIKGRYGSPSKAWSFHKSHNWYAMGEWDIRDDKDARVHKGEMIVPAKVADGVRTALAAPGMQGENRGKTTPSIVFQSGAINVSFGGDSIGPQEARVGSKMIVDAMMEDSRMKALAVGA